VGKTKQVNIRLTSEDYEQLGKIASAENLTVTDIVVRSIREYLERINVQFCQGCKTLNKPDSNYCSNCGLPLNPDSLDEFRKMYDFFQKHPGYQCIANSQENTLPKQ